MLNNYVGKIVDISVDHDLQFAGKLSNHAPNLYQVTGDENHFVFWEHDIIAFHCDTHNNNRLTIFI